jgi:hypothetical protein
LAWLPSLTRASFAVRVGEQVTRLRTSIATVLPKGTLTIQPLDEAGDPVPVHVASATPLADGSWAWHAPATPGVHPLRVIRADDGEAMTLNVFVLTPLARLRRGILDGFRVGRYPRPGVIQGSVVTPPAGFIKVTEANAGVAVSPHFTLGQFVAKQAGGWPKYLVLDPRLPRKLESLIERAQGAGLPVTTFTIMSGYRTPWYNRAIGNETTFSRHVWGAAADIFVDEAPKDGIMDDLNHDGRSDEADTEVLASLVDEMDADASASDVSGGLGRYAANASHGPFIHVDVRSSRARWERARRRIRLRRAGAGGRPDGPVRAAARSGARHTPAGTPRGTAGPAGTPAGACRPWRRCTPGRR